MATSNFNKPKKTNLFLTFGLQLFIQSENMYSQPNLFVTPCFVQSRFMVQTLYKQLLIEKLR